MNQFEKALEFATKAHEGTMRKGTNIPYITHPIEVAEILKTITDNENVWIAGLLHDTVEDSETTAEDISKLFGEEVARLVLSNTENKRKGMSKEETWKIRKEETLAKIEKMTKEEKMIILGDKLSNMRHLARDYREIGDKVWERFNQKDKNLHKWYYKGILDNIESDLGYTEGWKEYKTLLEEIFERE